MAARSTAHACGRAAAGAGPKLARRELAAARAASRLWLAARERPQENGGHEGTAAAKEQQSQENSGCEGTATTREQPRICP
jgi:hypothetical protein